MIIFLVVMGLTAAAAVPFFNKPSVAAADEEELPSEPEESLTNGQEDEETKVAKARPKAKARKPVRNWLGGGDVVVGGRGSTGRSGGSGGHTGGDPSKTWHYPTCNKVVGTGSSPPPKVTCCDRTYTNGRSWQ